MVISDRPALRVRRGAVWVLSSGIATAIFLPAFHTWAMARGLVGLADAVCGAIGGVAAWYAWNARNLRATAAQLEQTMSAQRDTARELRLEEERLRQIADTIPGALMQYRLDVDGQDRAEFLSNGSEAIFGFSPTQLRDDIRLAWDQIPPEDAARLVAARAESAANLTRWVQEFPVHRDGAVKWLRGEAVPEREPDGSTLWRGILVDVTETKLLERARRHQEETTRGLYEIANSISLGFEGRVRAMLSLVRQRLDGTVAALCREREGGMQLMFVDAEEPGFDEGRIFPAGQMFCCTVLGAEGPLSCAHIGESEWRAHPAYASLGMESFIGTRVTVAREPFGSACVWGRRPRPQGFDDGDQDLLRLVSMWIGAELEREDTAATLRSVHAELEERVIARTAELTVANQRLRLSEDRLRHALSVGRMGLWERDLRTGELEWDQRLREMLGAPMQGPVDISSWYWGRLEPDDRSRIKALIRQAETGGGDYRYECRYQRLDGRTSWLEVSGGARIGESGEPTHVAGMTVDVTARKEAEAELQRMTEELDRRVARRTADLDESRQRLRALLGELTMAEERERRRLADDLHDGLTQLLTLGRMNLARATRLLGSDSQPNQPALELLEQIRATLDTSIVYTRTLIGELSPRVLYDLGLPVALQWLADQMKPHGLDVTVTIDEAPLSLNDTQSVLLFQAVRELLWNVRKHAESPRADVRLHADDVEVRLEVEDAGKGFSERSSPASGGFGLLSIRERLAIQGGSIDIRSGPGQGTRVAIQLPLSEHTASEAGAQGPAAHPPADRIPAQDAPTGAGAGA